MRARRHLGAVGQPGDDEVGEHVRSDPLELAQTFHGQLADPTLSFQLKRGFRVLAVVAGYLRHDPESLGYAAVIELVNAAVARPEDWAGQPARFAPPC